MSGDLPSLGAWTDFSVFPMTRVEGDHWVSKRAFVTDKFVFQYKYVVVNDKFELIRWERGVNRVTDLEVMPNAEASKEAADYMGAEYLRHYREA